MDKIIGLRIDTDTLLGYKNGVVPLLKLLRKLDIKATFFIVAGYDTPFRVLQRVFKERGFCKRLFRIERVFPFKMFLSCGLTFKKIVGKINGEGHKIGLHGYHHFDWQIHIREWTSERVDIEMSKAVECFKNYTGFYPSSFAAPGWVTKEQVFLAEERFDFDYCSDTRGSFPFYPILDKRKLKTLQIPVTLQTLDELVSLGTARELVDMEVKPGDVYCAHAEFDGMQYINLFEQFLKRKLEEGYRFIPLSEMKQHLNRISTSNVVYRKIPGRTNIIAHQGKTEDSRQ